MEWACDDAGLARQVVAAPYLRGAEGDVNSDLGRWFIADNGTDLRDGIDVYRNGVSADGSELWKMVTTGRNCWKANDNYQGLYREVYGDGEFSVRLVRAQRMVEKSCGFGVQLRMKLGSLEKDKWLMSSYVEFTNPNDAVNTYAMARGGDTSIGYSSWDAGSKGRIGYEHVSGQFPSGVNIPVWLKVARRTENGKSIFTMSYSLDGKDYTVLGTKTLDGSSGPLYAGVFGMANASGAPEYEFDSVKCTFRSNRGFAIIVR